jgi:hypothetical protein
MSILARYLLLVLVLIGLIDCKRHKKPSLSGEDPVEVSDFIEFFPIAPAFQFTEKDLDKKDKDSLLISYKVFTQFVPDTLLAKNFGRGIRPKIYSMVRVQVPKEENYLFVKTIYGSKKIAFLLSFDKKQKFVAGMPILIPDQNPETTQISGIDRKFSIFKTVQRKNSDSSVNEGKEVFILNKEARNFMLILTDQLDEKPTELINPLDTLPRKNKLSADYSTDKMNLVSIRDGRKPDRFNFFIHFEKQKGECIGELKGEAKLRSATVAEYRTGADPCVLQFIFTSSVVTIKEIEGCGSHRGSKCVFEGSYPRKKIIIKKNRR